MPRKRKIEATTYEKPEAESPATAATTAPEGAPKRRRARKAKVDEPATTAPEATLIDGSEAIVEDTKPATEQVAQTTTKPGTTANTNDGTEANTIDAPEAAPAPRRQKATRKATKKPAAKTGADGGLTMAALADQYLAHLEAAGKSRGTVFSYSIDAALAVRHFGEGTLVSSLTAKKIQNFYESDLVTKTRTGKAKAQPTILKTRRVLRLALTWAAGSGLIPEAPLPTKGD